MNQGDETDTVMECSATYQHSDGDGSVAAAGEGRVRLDEESISILPAFGEVIFIQFRDILGLSGEDYKVHLDLSSNEKLVISGLGYKYEDFLRVLSKLRNEMILKDLLMHESLKKSGIECEFVSLDESGAERQRGRCLPRLYDTALVIIPEAGDFIRLPYSDISKIHEKDHTLIIDTERGENYILSMMGKDFDPFKRELSGIINELSLRVQSVLKDLLPGADSFTIRKVARLMKEGRAAKRADIDSVSPGLWQELEKMLDDSGVKGGYDFLASMSQHEKCCIGLKRGLLGDLTGDYIWFLIPIYGTNAKEPGNVIAMEAVSGGGGGGRATYFFRIMSRNDYRNIREIETLHTEADGFITQINHCMTAINFRREPVYLPEEKMGEPRYQKYRFAVAKIPELRKLREHFIGRVIHHSPEQWRQDVMDLLTYNVKTRDDGDRWIKGTMDVDYADEAEQGQT